MKNIKLEKISLKQGLKLLAEWRANLAIKYIEVDGLEASIQKLRKIIREKRK